MFEQESGAVTVTGCFMHLRRYFAEAFFINDISAMSDTELSQMPETKVLLIIREIYMEENKLKKIKSTSGDFRSGAGSYYLVPFNSLSGKFRQEGYTRKILFSDVVISLATGDVVTDAFSVERGKLALGPIYLVNEGGSLRIR